MINDTNDINDINDTNDKFNNIHDIKTLTLNEDYYNQLIELYSLNNNTIDKKIVTFKKFAYTIKSLPKNHTIYLYIKNDKIIACCSIIIEQKIIHNCGKVGHIQDIIVKVSERVNNIQSILIKYIIKKAKEKKCNRLDILSPVYLEKYYNKHDFIKEGLYMCNYISLSDK
jgi:glucosamine-phosphate N-acetyltransferase